MVTGQTERGQGKSDEASAPVADQRARPEESTGQDQLRGGGTRTVRLERPVARVVLSFRNPVVRQDCSWWSRK